MQASQRSCLPALPPPAQLQATKAQEKAQAAEREWQQLLLPRCEEGEAQTPAEEQDRSAGSEGNHRDFIIHRDLKGRFTHRSHPSYLPLQAGKKFLQSGVVHGAVPDLPWTHS